MNSVTCAVMVAAILSAGASAQTLSLDLDEWSVETGRDGSVEHGTYMGREALYISRGAAWREDIVLSDMVIEYAIAATQASGFMGVNFRTQRDGNLEQFYTRGHQSGQPDATQYQAMHNGMTAWQLHAGPNDAQAVELPAQAWIDVRIVAIGDAADIFVGDMETPLLHVPDLRSTSPEGFFGLFMSDRPWIEGSGAWFSDVSVRAAGPDDRLIGEARDEDAPGPGLIETWQVSDPLPESSLDSTPFRLTADPGGWETLDVDRNGVANLARLIGPSADANAVLVRTRITSRSDTIRRLHFGYSDRVRLFLNGEEIYAGNAGWRARDHRHLGTVTDVDTVPLSLRAGENALVAVVSESFGGWGFLGRIPDQEGLSLEP